MEPYEIEVKFHVTDMADVRKRILDAGADGKGRVFETNTRYDTPGRDLARKKSLLRLRKDSRARLTFKSLPEKSGSGQSTTPDSQFKIHREIEVEVDSFSSMNRIIESLGFTEKQIYEKWRETFMLRDATLCLDTMPFGNFLEIEGQKSDIIAISGQLGFKWEKRIVLNYIKMFELVKSGMNLSFSDITFKHFEKINVDLTEYIHMFEAG